MRTLPSRKLVWRLTHTLHRSHSVQTGLLCHTIARRKTQTPRWKANLRARRMRGTTVGSRGRVMNGRRSRVLLMPFRTAKTAQLQQNQSATGSLIIKPGTHQSRSSPPRPSTTPLPADHNDTPRLDPSIPPCQCYTIRIHRSGLRRTIRRRGQSRRVVKRGWRTSRWICEVWG